MIWEIFAGSGIFASRGERLGTRVCGFRAPRTRGTTSTSTASTRTRTATILSPPATTPPSSRSMARLVTSSGSSAEPTVNDPTSLSRSMHISTSSTTPGSSPSPMTVP
ncbi:hypothetical protein MPH_03047 [Macrophomina phaseolina MS6]|uniref:Uncharacterized protein n=1 Tax=Macrophomina phaseolina (strain MS6) TaxID=1126212 RepID=K2RAZ6_MACPH|nr:hypothetical protein MPH_03047 [Macrophomina phaseolina MS6]